MPILGEILRSEREKKGLSIKDIEKATSIRSLYLNAIEEQNYNVIPGEVYLKGFIRNYASYLGLNPQEMIDLYRQEKDPSPVETSTPVDKTRIIERTDASAANPEDVQTGKTKWIAIGLASVALAGAVWWFTGSHNSQPKPLVPTQEVKPGPALSTPVPQPTVPPQTQVTQSKPVTVIAKYTDECWTLVVADGKEIYEGIPKLGETLTWEAQSNISIQLGNAAGVEITYNGQTLGKMGGKGEVLNKSFSANTKKQ